MRANARALAYLAGAVFFWGTSFAVTKSAYAALPPMMVVWLRMVVALVAFLPLLRRVKRPDYRMGDWKFLALATLFLPCLYFLLEGFAIRFTTSSQAGVVSAVMPLIVAVSGWVILRERPASRTAIAVVVSIVGVAGLSLGGSVQSSAPNPVLGNLLEFSAMFAAAGATLTISRLSARYDPLLITGKLEKGEKGVKILVQAQKEGGSEWQQKNRGPAGDVRLLSEARSRTTKKVYFNLRMDDLPMERLDSLKGIIERHRGTVPSFLSFEMAPRGKATMQLPAELYVMPDDDLRLEVERLFGYNAATFE